MRLFSRKRPPPTVADYSLLQIKIPHGGNQGHGSTEQLTASIWEILLFEHRPKFSAALSDHISLELQARPDKINLFIWTPKSQAEAISKEIYGAFSGATVKKTVRDYSRPLRQTGVTCSAELGLTKNELLPIINPDSPHSEHYHAILKYLRTLRRGEEAWLQLLLRPVNDKWKQKGENTLARSQRGSVSEARRKEEAGINEKISRPGFRAKIRLVVQGPDQRRAKLLLQSFSQSFMYFNAVAPNGFKLKAVSLSPERQLEYYTRLFIDRGIILNTKEISSLFSFSSLDNIVINTTERRPARSPSRFEKLLAEAETNPQPKPALQPSVAKKLEVEPKPSKDRQPITRFLSLTAKVLAKKDVGKLAAGSTRSNQRLKDADDTSEHTIKIH